MIKKYLASIVEAFFPSNSEGRIDPDENYQTSSAWPAEWYKGIIKTSNRYGVMVTDLGPAEREFTEFSRTSKKPVMDIGCAYGVAARVALMHEAKVIACDISEEHLAYLRDSVPESWLHRLRTTNKRFPEQLEIKPESISGILAAGLFNYLKPEEITAGLEKCLQWLEPGGMLWITTYTPHLLPYRSLREPYKNAAAQGEPWPGQFNPRELSSNTWAQLSPEYMQVFKLEELEREIEKVGFEIESSQYFAYEYVRRWLKGFNGKEFLMISARKPFET